ncbi:DMT family transporter [Acidimangrovimonas pyrenivorans]|uniref:DMT family transporter n=1 Tax=Acidimangrovimonas pyrenivorans TaxID=2030798 RepID=A0ABV7ABV6_9RHOB
MTSDRPVLGILLMLVFCALATMGDATAKVLGGQVALIHLVTLRFVAQAVILVPLVLATGDSLRLSRRGLRLTVLRTLLHIAGIGTMISALRFLPLANAVAIAFVMPFIMLLLGRFILNEEVGSRRLMACVVGFVGTLLVIKPSFAEVGPPALLPLGVAVIFAFFMLVTRQVSREAGPVALQAVSGLVACVLLIPLSLLGRHIGLPPVGPLLTASQPWHLLVLLGALGTFAHLFMTWSLRFAPASTLAPMQYLEIPFATITGFVVFGDFPDGLALAGIGLTIAAGLYIVWRERALARPVERPAPAQP